MKKFMRLFFCFGIIASASPAFASPYRTACIEDYLTVPMNGDYGRAINAADSAALLTEPETLKACVPGDHTISTPAIIDRPIVLSMYGTRLIPATPIPLTITEWSITSNIATFAASNAFVSGDTVTLSGFGTSTFFNGAVVTVLSTGLSATQFEVSFTHANGGPTTEAGVANLPPLQSTPITITGGITTLGSTSMTFTSATGTLLNNMSIGGPGIQLATAIGYTTGTSITLSQPAIMTVGQPFSVTAWSIAGSGCSTSTLPCVATFTTVANTLTAGQPVVLSGFGTSTFFNGQSALVLSTGLSGTQFEINFIHAGGSATESGTAETSPDFYTAVATTTLITYTYNSTSLQNEFAQDIGAAINGVWIADPGYRTLTGLQGINISTLR